MTLIQIFLFLILALTIGAGLKGRSRMWTIYIFSLLATYILQPLVPLRNFDYWFPTFSIVLTAGTWLVVRRRTNPFALDDALAASMAGAIVVLIGLTSIFPFEIPWLTASTPNFSRILIVVAFCTLVGWFLSSSAGIRVAGRWIILLLILGLFVVLKTEPLSLWLSERLRLIQGQSVSLSSPLDLNWLGFSYIAFRLLHVLRDRRSGRLPDINLREFMTYVLFFPALVAGPIDRIERFVEELRLQNRLDGSEALEAGRRILLGAFKKFAIADGLALMALSPANASISTSMGWTWLLLYAYSFRLFFDFSGYTDIAIGLGTFTGLKLPENFDRPYSKTNMTAFWNSWHITLARWFRSYFFNPLTRWLRRGPLSNSPGLIILIGQLSTMLLIGLWHGVTVNFAFWGLWHGMGLYIHNRWVNYFRGPSKPEFFERLPRGATQGVGLLLTFHFVTLGWVWFALPDFNLSASVLSILLGIAG